MYGLDVFVWILHWLYKGPGVHLALSLSVVFAAGKIEREIAKENNIKIHIWKIKEDYKDEKHISCILFVCYILQLTNAL